MIFTHEVRPICAQCLRRARSIFTRPLRRGQNNTVAKYYKRRNPRKSGCCKNHAACASAYYIIIYKYIYKLLFSTQVSGVVQVVGSCLMGRNTGPRPAADIVVAPIPRWRWSMVTRLSKIYCPRFILDLSLCTYMPPPSSLATAICRLLRKNQLHSRSHPSRVWYRYTAWRRS